MTVIKQSHYEAIDPGTYRAQVGAVALEDGQFGPQLKVRFDLAAGEDVPEGKSIMAWCSAKLSPKSKLYAWVSALLFGGRGVPADYDLDTDALLDKAVLLLVEIVEKDGGEFNRVKELLPVRRAPKAGATNGTPTNGTPAAATSSRAVVNNTAAGPAEMPDWIADELGGAL